jgi:hypothetical protein
MSNQWIQERRGVFERDLIQDFFEAKLFFDTIARAYQRSDAVSFERLNTWVGSDEKKGPLWLLKDHSQRLYRSSSNAGSLFENLFDWTVGSIFHETIKLKEEAYQIESYKPLLEMKVKNKSHDATLGTIIQEYFVLIERAKENVPIGVQSITELFNKALYHLHEIIFAGRENMLILLLLLNKEKNANAVFGRDQYRDLLKRMFPEGLHAAWIAAGRYYLEGGWHTQARPFIERSLEIQADNACALELLASITTAEEKPRDLSG